MSRNNSTTREDAISESIGFVLIFSLVIVGISLVTLYGYPVLLKQQASADQQIMEKNMIVIQNDLKSLTYKTVPFKETSLKVGGGTLYALNSTTSGQSFNITYGTTIDSYPLAGKLGELRYESNDQQQIVAIENGAVIYRQPQYAVSGSTMLAEPRWFYDAPTKTAVVYMINLSSTNTLSLAGVGTVQTHLVNTSFQIFSRNPGSDPPFYVGYLPNSDPTKNEDYSGAWRNYITKTLGWTETPAGSGRYQVPSDATTLVVKEYDVIVTSL